MRTLRGFTEHTVDQEPKWRHKGTRLDTGYDPPWRQ
jgi:hydrogenase small subunit